jgi:putative hydrolase of the HAD superfamily
VDNRRSDELISTILFDADGVMQRTAMGWQDELIGFLGDRSDSEGEAFLEAIRRAEEPTMDGRTDIAIPMASVLHEFAVEADVDDVLELWTRIEPHADMIDAVADLRRDRVRCCLTTNQQNRRAAWMRHHLGYDLVFDQQFYSCELGLAKPDPAYFTTILESLDVKPSTVLFVDDTAVNVDGARTTGLNAELFPRHGGRPALAEILRSYVVLGS